MTQKKHTVLNSIQSGDGKLPAGYNIEEVCRKFGLASSVLHRWRKEFAEHGPNIFSDKRDVQTRWQSQGFAPGESLDELKQLIGELTVQNEVLKKSREPLDR